METIEYTKVKFLDDRIVYADDGRVLIYLKEVWAIGYKKASFLNLMFSKYDWMAMGILYIAKPTTMKVKDLIAIYMPYEVVKSLPKSWLKKTEFYERGRPMKIDGVK